MRWMAAIGLALFLVATTGTAGAEPKGPAMDVEQGRMALMFHMGGLFNSTPTSFDDIGVGGRYALMDRLHLRAALGINYQSSEFDPDGGDSEEDKASSFGLEGGIDYILFRRSNLLIYTGGILQFGFAGTDPDGEDNEVDVTSWTLAALLGASWFFTDNVSLGAEYRFGVESTSQKTDNAETSGLRVGTGSASFLLGFWF